MEFASLISLPKEKLNLIVLIKVNTNSLLKMPLLLLLVLLLLSPVLLRQSPPGWERLRGKKGTRKVHREIKRLYVVLSLSVSLGKELGHALLGYTRVT